MSAELVGTSDMFENQEGAEAETFTRQPIFDVAPESAVAPPGMRKRVDGWTNASEEVTMDALERLFDWKLGRVQEEIAALKTHALSKIHLGEALAPFAKDIECVKDSKLRRLQQRRHGLQWMPLKLTLNNA